MKPERIIKTAMFLAVMILVLTSIVNEIKEFRQISREKQHPTISIQPQQQPVHRNLAVRIQRKEMFNHKQKIVWKT